jgi:hypothetical protein
MSAQSDAVKRADERAEFMVRYGFDDVGYQVTDAMTRNEAADLVSRIFLTPFIKIKVLKVIEDYE